MNLNLEKKILKLKSLVNFKSLKVSRIYNFHFAMIHVCLCYKNYVLNYCLSFCEMSKTCESCSKIFKILLKRL